jgi:RNA polymerase sigma factor (TIGR02999 family)
VSPRSQEITVLLGRTREGSTSARAELVALLYPELRRIAERYMGRERRGHTLQTTALVNEAFVRLVEGEERGWQNRAHFYATAATAMRRILVDYARQSACMKRGGNQQRIDLDQVAIGTENNPDNILALDSALERLRQLDARQEQVVELRFFGGLSVGEIAEVLGISERTVKRDWSMARAWLHAEIAAEHPNEPGTLG